MFSYYGSKSKVVHLYPSPKFSKIIEPFAGSARYSLKYFDRDVLLVDTYPVIVDLWKWLQKATPADILCLPEMHEGQSLDCFDIPKEAKYLIGFCINGGSAQPKKTMKDFSTWNENRRAIANSLYKIKHWKIELGDYRNIPNQEATWFIDPPYQFGGEWYVKNNKHINYPALGDWCKSRDGQIIVCENTKADWLPFYTMREMTGSIHTTTEAIWSNYPHDFQARQPGLFASVQP
jgi:site-specific DNA-adenine methylase